MKRRIRALWIVLVLCSIAGCAGNRMSPPGPMQQQQFKASLYDPYTDVDAGPEVVGGRPRDFQKPLPEADRSRWLRSFWWTGS